MKRESSGMNLKSVKEAFSIFYSQADGVLLKVGIEDVQPDQWYDLDLVVQAFEAISNQIGNYSTTLVGIHIGENAALPPVVTDLEQVFMSLDQAYKLNNRGPDIGGWKIERDGRDFTFTVTTPFLCPLEKGILLGFSKRFGQPIDIRHGDLCRKEKDAACIYHVSIQT